MDHDFAAAECELQRHFANGFNSEMIWVRLFSAKNFRLSRCHFEFIILRYRNIIALVLLTIVKDHVVLKITASAKGA